MFTNAALDELLQPESTTVSPNSTSSGSHYIPPRYTSQGTESRVHRKSSEHLKGVNRMQGIKEAGSPSKEQESVWYEYGTV
jgi:hypothetical protein